MKARTKDEYLEILFYDKNQVYDKIAWGLGEGCISFIPNFSANDTPFLKKYRYSLMFASLKTHPVYK